MWEALTLPLGKISRVHKMSWACERAIRVAVKPTPDALNGKNCWNHKIIHMVFRPPPLLPFRNAHFQDSDSTQRVFPYYNLQQFTRNGIVLFIPFLRRNSVFPFPFESFIFIIIFGRALHSWVSKISFNCRNCDAVPIHQIRFLHFFPFIGWIGFTSEW